MGPQNTAELFEPWGCLCWITLHC